jgi:hypothetical protein
MRPQTYGEPPDLNVMFSIVGANLDLDAITSLSGLTPTSTGRAGRRSTKPLVPPLDSWFLTTPSQPSVDGTTAIAEMVELLDGHREGILQALNRHPSALATITLIAGIQPHRYPALPQVTLAPDTITKLARLTIPLVFDFHVYGDDDSN